MELTQTELFAAHGGKPSVGSAPVNVASVPQRSIFRYPGGKTWLVPEIRRWLSQRRPRLLVEPFAGGGIVGLTAAFENLADEVLMVELDADVASVWQLVLGEDAEWLAREILAFGMGVEAVRERLAQAPTTLRERGFQTVLRNRVNHGGILAPGSGVLKHGENGRGIASRWYPETLARRIRALASVRQRIRFVHGDAFDLMPEHAGAADVAFFVDPPYTAPGKRAGSRLYTHSVLDHERLFDAMQRVRGDFMLTYDDAPAVREMATRRGFTLRNVAMKNTHHAEMTELLIRPAQRPAQHP